MQGFTATEEQQREMEAILLRLHHQELGDVVDVTDESDADSQARHTLHTH